MPMGRPEETQDRVNMAEGQKGCLSQNDSGRESWESQTIGTSTGKSSDIRTSGRKIYEKSPAKETPQHPLLKLTDRKRSFYDRFTKRKAAVRTSGREIGEEPPTKLASRRPSLNSAINDRFSRPREVVFENDVSNVNYHAEEFYGGRGSALPDDAGRESLGFASGPRWPYYLHNTFGWLDE